MSRIDDLATALVTALAVDHGGGTDPGLDLSAAGAVLRGAYARPPRLPFVAVDGVAVDGTRAGSLSLRHWQWTATWSVIAWVPVETLTADARVTRAEEAMMALLDAITAASVTPGNALYGVPNLVFSAVTVDSALAEAAEHAAVIGLSVTATVQNTGGP